MGELIKVVLSTILINQSVMVGSKIINNKRVTQNEREGLGLALVTYALVNLAMQQPTPKVVVRH